MTDLTYSADLFCPGHTKEPAMTTTGDPTTPAAFLDPADQRIYLNGRRFADLPYVMDADADAVPLYLVSVNDRDEVRNLRRWKEEALPVLAGMQELGTALGLRLGTQITGPEAVEAASALHQRVEAAEAEREIAHNGMLHAGAEVQRLRDAWTALDEHQWTGEVLAVFGEAWINCSCGERINLPAAEGKVNGGAVAPAIAAHQAAVLLAPQVQEKPGAGEPA
jgi:hypothetical protein